jgi:hypothetical protein
MPSLSMLSADIMAVGALGTAAFGLVDALKAMPGGGISRAGFKFIRQVVVQLTPPDPALDSGGLSRDSILFSLMSQWINGADSGDQLNIAKSLIKLRLTPNTAAALARSTGVDPIILGQVATNIEAGTPLTTQPPSNVTGTPSTVQLQSDVYGRFDLMLTTLLDQAYQRADQRYRNVAKITAVPVAIALALTAAYVLPNGTIGWGQAALLGIIATPVAPIAKDLSTAISTGAQAIQTLKG